MLGSDLRDQLTDSAVASIGNKAIATGTAVTAAGWLTLNNMLAIGGFLIALAGLVLTWAYKRRQDERDRLEFLRLDRIRVLEEEYQKARLERLRASGPHAVVDEP
jgi:hypothetical protein